MQCVETWPPWMRNTFTLVVLCIQYLLPLIVLPLVHSQVPPRPRPQLGMLIAFDCILCTDFELPGEEFWAGSGHEAEGEGAEAEQEDDLCPLHHRHHLRGEWTLSLV